MIKLITLCFLIFFLISCKKKYTSNFKGKFISQISIDHHAVSNSTRIIAIFHDADEPFYYGLGAPTPLKIRNRGYIKVNGIDLEWHESGGYFLDLKGKPTCTIEFKDHDGSVYRNTIAPPDTTYFVNFPDSVSSTGNFSFQVSAPNLDSNEFSLIALDDDYYNDIHFWDYAGTDTIIEIEDVGFYTSNFITDGNHFMNLNRAKKMLNPNLPTGGGEIVYHYNLVQYFYIK